ncbi:LTA synthase family protein [Kozakia baliensis]|uniref:LTA synthase family protein n=1 Tax=Kozakia baliensis TaxID=153496 RepID=UPI00345C27BF
MSVFFLSLFFLTISAEAIDAFTIPRGFIRDPRGIPFRVLFATALLSAFSILTGSIWFAFAASLFIVLALVIGSNLKHRMLGEPLVFSDLVVASSFLKEPKFYLHAIPPALLGLIAVLLPLLLAGFAFVSWHGALTNRLAGIVGLSISIGLLHVLLARTTLMPIPRLVGDTKQFGAIPTILVYWHRWRQEPDAAPPPALPAADSAPELVIIVQCESFADPAELNLQPSQLPGLEQARQHASLHGKLHVSGFGAYTMRTEYGVLCGRSEKDLGFRHYDPFLTASQDQGFALPHRLAHLYPQRVFVHPHDLRFYSRDRLMPELGFNRIVAEQDFAEALRIGPYISDEALGQKLKQLASESMKPTLIYAVSMENHGPWKAGRLDATDGAGAYTQHLANSDLMLADLTAMLEQDGRSALLVFFGDHRPSIPGQIEAQPERHTPYTMLRFPRDTENSVQDLTPAELHHAILAEILRAQAGNTAA